MSEAGGPAAGIGAGRGARGAGRGARGVRAQIGDGSLTSTFTPRGNSGDVEGGGECHKGGVFAWMGRRAGGKSSAAAHAEEGRRRAERACGVVRQAVHGTAPLIINADLDGGAGEGVTTAGRGAYVPPEVSASFTEL